MYKKVDANLNFVDREKQIEKFWNDNDIFKKSMEHRKEGETYTFYDGPPTANGKPHIGHVETRTIKDMIPRYQTMKGKFVPRKAGWDTHGLPVELEVEKLLGLNGKEQIEEYGMEPFIKKCKESVWKYKGMWEDFSKTVGFWADMDNPYVTYNDNFIESEWWALKTIWDKGLLYKGFKIVPYCPRCGTPLSSHEVAQGYKAVKERSAVVRFKVAGEDAYFLAWTTTPWTLPSNVALCVNPEETYCKVKAADGYVYYMAKALLDKVLGKLGTEETPAYEILETYKGTDLEYKEYVPLYEGAAKSAEKQHKKAHFVTCADYVTMSDGTGIVHIAPAFGEDDANVGRKYDLPFVQFVDGKGELTKETPYAGIFVKKADPEVLKDLENMYLLEDHMDDYKISLSDDEKKAIKDAAKEFSKDNDKDDKEKVSGDTEYVERYLTSLPVVNQDLDLIISQLQSTEYGVPVQIYFFSRNKIWKEYERIQSDIFDHFFAMIPKFELKVYQYSD